MKKIDRFGYTQYERRERNNAIWRYLRELLPSRPMKKSEIFNIIMPRWPEKTRNGISLILSPYSRSADVFQSYIIAEPIPVKHCKWCGKDLVNRRYTYCSKECEKAYRFSTRIHVHKKPVLQSISLLCRDFHNNEHDCLSHLAFEIAKTSEPDAANPRIIGSAWLGIKEAWEAGERNKPDLISAAQSEIKKFNKHDWVSHLSLDKALTDDGFNLYDDINKDKVIQF
jgi:hypothetical protein